MKNPFALLWSILAVRWKMFRARKDIKAHGVVGAVLRDAVRNLEPAEVHDGRTAFAAKFLTYSNRQRAAWLQSNDIRVRVIHGKTVRQCQQMAALQWFDELNGGK